ncbi:telomere repeat-binding factor 1 isoform X2 [Capsicum annuum]|uniref:telomere repeat-binding factor 1 isoform X2 n=1 Tax=Capsicum annuum TaxID=4072 RepID=UPI001FB0CFE3|nr:telomere repeat-binding factor 1 isoform X2 [Capsicum annuum]XP_047262471.1 telomere repeat-binding factor 1 isoform X2 [Capsicum annuum]
MGAPKQKWTAEEEAALKAGVAKYGVGKWSTILKDPEFAVVLRSRSNVDLKDKWRNLHVMASGWGSRHRGRAVSKSVQPAPKHDDNNLVSSVGENDIEALDAKPLASSGEVLKDVGSKKPLTRLDDLILEAIVKLKEPRGSSRNTISSFIEVKHYYRIAPSRVSSDAKGGSFSSLMGGKLDSTVVEKNETRILTKAQIDADLEQMKSMSAEEAAAAAAQAVAEAEAAIAEAERAARIAEECEAEAEAAQCFAEVASKALQHQTIRV